MQAVRAALPWRAATPLGGPMIRPVRRANHLFDAFVETLSSTVGMGSRLLLTPVMR